MKTRNAHLIIIIGTLILSLVPLAFFTINFTSNYIKYKSCKSFEDYSMLCSKLENENCLLNYNVFYNKALLKREELHSLFIEDSITAVEVAAAEAAANYNIENKTNIENDYILSLIRSATYHSYYNSRFDFHLTYPSFLMAEDESINGDGRRFSMDNDILLIASGINNINNENIIEKYRKNDIKSLAYSKLKDNWYIISDYTTDGRIFYQKTVLHNDAFITVELYFPPKYKNEFDIIIKNLFTKFPY